MTTLRLGTRGSALALWQARTVASALEARGADVEVVTITTQGDRRQDVALPDIGGKRVFVKEIEDALLAGEIDLAVHSAKDMAAERTAGLMIAAALPREDPRDAMVLRAGSPEGLRYETAVAQGFSPALIGTGSARRIGQLARQFPGATFVPVRGNVDTRLRKLDAGEMDALVLAAAGLTRLGLSARITTTFPTDVCVPAPGQGIIAIEVRTDDERTYAQVAPLGNNDARVALSAEQAVVAGIGGGCQLPLGAYATIRDGSLLLRAVVASLNGEEVVSSNVAGHPGDAVALGRQAANELSARGARRLLQS
ncbi:MAG TPA: hydroxymethylbilane synthase [Vicinamibacterales bacterium]|nr:hydroxymethylbilane synthase [Vicinamibacterales bacterium]